MPPEPKKKKEPASRTRRMVALDEQTHRDLRALAQSQKRTMSNAVAWLVHGFCKKSEKSRV